MTIKKNHAQELKDKAKENKMKVMIRASYQKKKKGICLFV